MRKFIIHLFVSAWTLCLSQNKNLKDSIFKSGDIIRIPEIVYVLDGNGTENDSALKTVSSFINLHKNMLFEISSHSDTRGKPPRNSELTVGRAESVRTVLIDRYNVDPNQITAKGYGQTRPLINEIEIRKAKSNQEKEVLHSKNRRTELKVIEVK